MLNVLAVAIVKKSERTFFNASTSSQNLALSLLFRLDEDIQFYLIVS